MSLIWDRVRCFSSGLQREGDTRWDYGYDDLGQVTSGVRKTGNGTAIPGFNFAYDFDEIGNRESATINGRIESYSPDILNLYTAKTNAGAFDVVGTVAANETVVVRGATPSSPPIPASRVQNWFAAQQTANNTAGPVLANATVLAAIPGGGPGGNDVVTIQNRSQLVRPATETFTNDDDGSLVADGLSTYTWDCENRLVAVTPKTGNEVLLGAKFAFGYDGESRRIWSERTPWVAGNSTWASPVRTRFVYDGWNVIAELTQVSGFPFQVSSSFTWGPDLSGTMQGAGGIGGYLFFRPASSPSLASTPFYDGNGNVLGLLATDGQTVTARYEYGPFGEPLAKSGPVADLNPFRWSTKFTDETGLVAYPRRYLNPGTGRWVGTDPLGEEGGLNLLDYLNNDPVSAVDPLGLKIDRCTVAVSTLTATPDSTLKSEGQTTINAPDIEERNWGVVGTLNMTGKPDLKIKFNPTLVSDPNVGPPFDAAGRTVMQHEHIHAEYRKEEWNQVADELNSIEGCHWGKCWALARKLHKKIVEVYRADWQRKHWELHGGGGPPADWTGLINLKSEFATGDCW